MLHKGMKRSVLSIAVKERPGSHKTRVYDDGEFVDSDTSSLPVFNVNNNSSYNNVNNNSINNRSENRFDLRKA